MEFSIQLMKIGDVGGSKWVRGEFPFDYLMEVYLRGTLLNKINKLGIYSHGR